MTELLTAAQMRAIERAAIDSGEVTGLELMERAGRGVVEAIFEEWPELAKTDHKAVVLCGPGNNGGDGFVVARLLKDWGWEVEVFLYGDKEKLPPDAKVNCERWLEMAPSTCEIGQSAFSESDLVVDALFGTGLSRSIDDPELCELLWNIEDTTQLNCDVTKDYRNTLKTQPPRTVAVDIPSGLDSDSGRAIGDEPLHGQGVSRVMLTVTFHRSKVGHYLSEGPLNTGKLVVVDIGLEDTAKAIRKSELKAGRKVRRAAIIAKVRLTFETYQVYKGIRENKFTHGHALILSGAPGHGGAARLAARGALRIGAGLVSVACPPDALAEHAAQLNAIMVRAFDGAAGLAEVLSDDRISSITLGPGLGLTDATKALVEIALKSGKKCVLDADALSIYAGDESALFALCHDDVVLTPHGGEFARLFPDISDKLNAPATKGPAYSKVDATREAAKRAGCVVLYKGADTVIAAPDGQCSINSAHYERAAPWLATAGSGDVLAGFIGGLLARGFSAMQAAETAAWLHVECARSF
ncbi:MAG: NAD(P)H-hydrate dehydratase, partial [Alphaproteobacteria bacterium]|nr:NAD(P)H-hydrate dehydratase [Alphaproteobacteria bacterium]